MFSFLFSPELSIRFWSRRRLTPGFFSFAPCRRLIVRLPRNSIELLRDCLVGLPSLHTLGIANGSGYIEPQAFKSVSKHRLDFPNIKKVAIPAFAYPILALLPNVEEIVCFSGSVPVRSVTSILRKLRKPYQSARVEPVLKSVKVVCTDLDVGCTKSTCTTFTLFSSVPYPGALLVLVGRFPRLRKLCLPEVNSPPLSTSPLSLSLSPPADVSSFP